MTKSPKRTAATPAPPRKHEYLWLDLETTGLDPHADIPLEFGAILAADDYNGDMSIIEAYTAPIRPDDTIGAQASMQNMDPYVVAMHTKNGLLDAVASDAAVARAEADSFLASICERLGAKPRSVRLAGNSVHFDLAFCRVHFPAFSQFLSHRVLDCSTLTGIVKSWRVDPDEWARPEQHRALPDVEASLKNAALFRRAWLAQPEQR